MRGFVVTLISMSLIIILLMLAISLRSGQLASERYLSEPLPMIYGAVIVDDAGYELNSLIGPSMSFEAGNDSMGLLIVDTMDEENESALLEAYALFLEGKVAERTASNITLDMSNISQLTDRVWIDGDYLYTNDHSDREVVLSREGGSGASYYEVNFTVFSQRANVSAPAYDPNGTINVTIIYTDLNGTEVEEGTLAADGSGTFRVEYVGGTSMEVKVGRIEGKDGSLGLRGEGIYAPF